ncbi:hypothetical protein V6N13_092951 [Hibiscus sabdariffa]
MNGTVAHLAMPKFELMHFHTVEPLSLSLSELHLKLFEFVLLLRMLLGIGTNVGYKNVLMWDQHCLGARKHATTALRKAG